MKAWIGLGSNLGDREQYIKEALAAIEKNGIKILSVAKMKETEAYGLEDQPSFLNTVALLETDLFPHDLLKLLLEIEKSLGRTREIKWGPRTIDLDILFYEDEIIDSDNLKVPHPDLQNRLFVLEPLAEISPDKTHPIFKKTIKELLIELNMLENMKWVESKSLFGIKLGLDNTMELLDGLGNPHKNIKCIHVAGTNGKGSTCNFISKVLEEAGYSVGLFTSPFIQTFRERFQINGVNISPEDLNYHIERARKVAEKMEEKASPPTHFEIITGICFDYFNEKNVDFAVIEVGLGGLYDSTNVIENPIATLITTIDYDHMEYLGDTLEKIAGQKAGIIKPGSPVFLYPNQKSVMETIEGIADERKAPYYTYNKEELEVLKISEDGVVFNFRNFKNLSISMVGQHQAYNACLAVICLEELKKRGKIKYTEDELREGLYSSKVIARLELLQKEPKVLLDGSHNIEGVTALVNALKYYSYDKLILGIGILKDKKHLEMVNMLAPLADKIILTEVPSDRLLEAEKLKEEIDFNGEIIIEKDIPKALKKTLSLAEKDDMVVWAGSLYLMGALRDAYFKEDEEC
ncbi:MAG: 2-amino-4-hydroxy-6-hydroxymethyldihydropteridine diphosphokinase [Tissierellia bacterium]|nr:2-amino-4-hydroxy-6-hydroxymethyldihydropteridine diphosphokinase [Tissierellia bacterium]